MTAATDSQVSIELRGTHTGEIKPVFRSSPSNKGMTVDEFEANVFHSPRTILHDLCVTPAK